MFTDGDFDVSFPALLQFITGSDVVPPLGFEKKITIDFYEMLSCRHYPTSSTCDLRLWLPCNVDIDCLKSLISDAVKGAHGFGKV